jgi:putative sterol carrier protein
VAVKFLSEQWAHEMTDALNSSDDFKRAASGQQVKVQQVVTGRPGGTGEDRYYFTLDGGKAQIAVGEIADADATIIQNYETAAAISRSEVNAQQAFMQGKLKITGNMMKLMQLQGVFNALPRAVSGVEVEY